VLEDADAEAPADKDAEVPADADAEVPADSDAEGLEDADAPFALGRAGGGRGPTVAAGASGCGASGTGREA
jgi:hypothetical protein